LVSTRCAAGSVVAVALVAGGLAPAPSPAPPFPGDGVAGFGDPTPIELCVGSARVVSPDLASLAGSVCVGAGEQATACADDTECSGIERCVCGRCIVEACETSADCSGGRVCNSRRCTQGCIADGDCPSGEGCNSGGCSRPCSSDGACHYGERCDALLNVCVTKVCSDVKPCAPGDTCEAGTIAAALHEPEVTTIGGASVAFVELRPGDAGSGAIYRATVDGPSRWTANPSMPVLASVMGQGTGGPSVLVAAGRIDLYFTIGDGQGIGHAVSSDGGMTFMPDAAPVLVPASSWEHGWIGSPAVVSYQGATLLFYEGGPRSGVGLARIDASGTAARASDTPIVTPSTLEDPLFWRDVSEVGAPYAVVAGDVLRVYVTGRGVEGSDAVRGDAALPADVNDSIGMVASRDGTSFTPYPTGPVLAQVTNLRAYLGEREAAVRLSSGGGAEITFVATDAAGTTESGLARATQ
jgi:hypothetical protein